MNSLDTVDFMKGFVFGLAVGMVLCGVLVEVLTLL